MTALALLFAVPLGYALARLRFRGSCRGDLSIQHFELLASGLQRLTCGGHLLL